MITLGEFGRPLAIIKGGLQNGEIIYLYSAEDSKDEEAKAIGYDPVDLIQDEYIMNLKKKMTREEFKQLKRSLLKNDTNDKRIRKLLNDNYEKSLKEFNIYGDGRIQPLPDFNESSRVYVAGPTGSGKSWYSRNLLKQYLKVQPESKIYLFSDVEKDPVLDELPNLKRIPLNESILDNPFKPEDFLNSICLFDDIDSIENPKVHKAVFNWMNTLLRRGRHENISTIVTSHLITDYKNTRIVLNEVSAITFFPRAGGKQGIEYMLKKYVGLDKTQINKIFTLPSRWVTVYKNANPCQYVMYEKGLYLL